MYDLFTFFTFLKISLHNSYGERGILAIAKYIGLNVARIRCSLRQITLFL